MGVRPIACAIATFSAFLLPAYSDDFANAQQIGLLLEPRLLDIGDIVEGLRVGFHVDEVHKRL